MQDEKRLNYLDSIRGIAALIVVSEHCWLTHAASLKPYTYLGTALKSVSGFLIYIFMRMFTSGRPSVITFFVLSGFVLAYSLSRHPASYLTYAVRRFFRIYPTFLFVVLVSYLLHSIIGLRHSSNEVYLQHLAEVVPSGKMLITHLLMLGIPDGKELDGAVWTLIYEMRISLIFPLVLMLVQKYNWRAVLGFWGFSAACVFYVFFSGGDPKGYTEDTFIMSLIETGAFLVFFAVGAYMVLEREAIAKRILALSTIQRLLLFICLMFALFKSDPGTPQAPFYMQSIFVDYLHGLGAAGIISIAFSLPTVGALLGRGILVWLGRISYSLYLVHLPIIYVITQTIGYSWSYLQITVVAITLSLIAAEAISKLIEFPSIKLGKVLIKPPA